MRALPALTLLLCTQLFLYDGAGAAADIEEVDNDDDGSDSAPFMITVEHRKPTGKVTWRCSGSLVSMRTSVTSSECTRTKDASLELWAVAASTAAGLSSEADGERRVSRVAYAGKAPLSNGEWSEALLDLAVVELEKPFGSGARARPILMATSPDECANNNVCHVVRSLIGQDGVTRLRIVDAKMEAETPCSTNIRHWSTMRERGLCLTGPDLCQSEWGAGVVCGGKLCGVMSRSGLAGGPPEPECGDTHAAQSVARWRRFLHCAHTLRACGKGSCADMCSEKRLLDEPAGAYSDSTRSTVQHATLTPKELDAGHSVSPAKTVPPNDTSVDQAFYSAFKLEQEMNRVVSEIYPTRSQSPASSVVRSTLPLGKKRRLKPTRTSYKTTTRAHVDNTSPTLQSTTETHRRKMPNVESSTPVNTPTDVASMEKPQNKKKLVQDTTQLVHATEESSKSQDKAYVAPPISPHVFAFGATLDPGFGTQMHRTSAVQRQTMTRATEALTDTTHNGSVRPAALFEPNRPDFKAGEYGDNAADYADSLEEPAPSTTTTTPAPPSTKAYDSTSTKTAPDQRFRKPGPPRANEEKLNGSPRIYHHTSTTFLTFVLIFLTL